MRSPRSLALAAAVAAAFAAAVAAGGCSSPPKAAVDARVIASDARPDGAIDAAIDAPDAGPAVAPTPPTGDALVGLTLFDGWTDPHALAAPVNTTGWEDSAYISADGQRLYFGYTQYDYTLLQQGMVVADGPLRPGEIRPGFEIYEATIANGAWTVTVSTSNSSDTAANISEASVGVDDAQDLLTLVRYDGSPEAGDLYLSTKSAGVWGTSQALPTPVNSACVDDNGALSRDGTRLFFDSNRADALGTTCKSTSSAGVRTIYVTDWNGSAWSDPVAIGGAPNGGYYHWQVYPREDPVLYWAGGDASCGGDSCIYHATKQLDGTYGDQVLVMEPTASATATVGQVEGVGEVSITDDGHWMYFVYILKTATGSDLNIGVASHP